MFTNLRKNNVEQFAHIQFQKLLSFTKKCTADKRNDDESMWNSTGI